jgi:hypothetical protein
MTPPAGSGEGQPPAGPLPSGSAPTCFLVFGAESAGVRHTRRGVPVGTPLRCLSGARGDVSGRGVSQYAPTTRMGPGEWPQASRDIRPSSLRVAGYRTERAALGTRGRGVPIGTPLRCFVRGAGGCQWQGRIAIRPYDTDGTKMGWLRGTALGGGALQRVMTDPPRVVGGRGVLRYAPTTRMGPRWGGYAERRSGEGHRSGS